MINKVIFSVIRQTYLPLFFSKLQSPQVDNDEKKKAVEDYQAIVKKSWEVLRCLKGIFEL